ncbi:transposase [Microvirga ossetica]|uniref:transposase n=1 Tax=Microvirga ossetica TaxID=1882682 RepID=UPI001F2AF519|nr:transposase [Microvirga ossetica]
MRQAREHWHTKRLMDGPRGYKGSTTIKCCKRHLLGDTQGTLLKTKVYPADIHDRAGGRACIVRPVASLSGDRANVGRYRLSWPEDWLRRALGRKLSIPRHWWIGGVWMRVDAEPPTRSSGFQVLARRWIVERLIVWLTTSRRLAKDYERLLETG